MKHYIIGTISKPQGVKGELKIQPLTDNAERFLQLKKVSIDTVGNDYAVRSVRVYGGFVYMSLEGIDSRNDAELFRNKNIVVDKDNAIRLPDGRSFIVDLVGCSVYGDGNLIGVLTGVLQGKATDVFVLDTDKGECMFPCVDDVITLMDTDNKRIEINAARFAEIACFNDK